MFHVSALGMWADRNDKGASLAEWFEVWVWAQAISGVFDLVIKIQKFELVRVAKTSLRYLKFDW